MCRDGCESLPTTSVGINMMAGAIAGIFEHCIMYPLDSVKTRMQSLLPAVSTLSISSTFWNMIQKEGKLRPIRGIMAVVIGAGPGHALYFGSYELTKQFMSDYTTHNINYMSSAMVATFVHAGIATPTEAIKQRLQMYQSPYRNVFHCVKLVYRAEGMKAFYRSYGAQVAMNIPHQIVHFTTYEFLQNHFNKERKYYPPFHVVAGGISGGTAAAITTPMDVVKTLLNTQETGLTQTMPDAIKRIYKIAGLKGFFKGITARVLYTMPATAICWSTYEFFKFYLCGVTSESYKSSVSGKHHHHHHHHGETTNIPELLLPESHTDELAVKMNIAANDKTTGEMLLISQPPISEVRFHGST